MAVIYTDPYTVYRGSEPVFSFTITIDGGGTDRVFYFRVGRLGAAALIEKTMTETDSTGTSVVVTCSLTEAETEEMKQTVMDFQIICSSPLDVVTEGKLRMLPMIRQSLP
jgi:hypothetical protein